MSRYNVIIKSVLPFPCPLQVRSRTLLLPHHRPSSHEVESDRNTATSKLAAGAVSCPVRQGAGGCQLHLLKRPPSKERPGCRRRLRLPACVTSASITRDIWHWNVSGLYRNHQSDAYLRIIFDSSDTHVALPNSPPRRPRHILGRTFRRGLGADSPA